MYSVHSQNFHSKSSSQCQQVNFYLTCYHRNLFLTIACPYHNKSYHFSTLFICVLPHHFPVFVKVPLTKLTKIAAFLALLSAQSQSGCYIIQVFFYSNTPLLDTDFCLCLLVRHGHSKIKWLKTATIHYFL